MLKNDEILVEWLTDKRDEYFMKESKNSFYYMKNQVIIHAFDKIIDEVKAGRGPKLFNDTNYYL